MWKIKSKSPKSVFLLLNIAGDIAQHNIDGSCTHFYNCLNLGSSLEPQYDYFAGTVQVLKAVGSHMVLTFCYQMPDKQMFSVVLSREHKLTNSDIHGLHNLFTRKGIETYKIKKVCVSSSNKNVVFNVFVLISLSFSLLFSVQVSLSWK